MSKKNVNATAVLTEQLEKSPTTTAMYAINAMRRPILVRAIEGSRRAVREADAEESGCSKEAFKAWKNDVQDLYDSAVDFYESLGTDEESEAEAECLKVWQRILRAGEEKPLQPRMYIRPTDAHNLRVWACESETKQVRGIGTVGVYTGVDRFRGIIETRIALRIAGNAILDDEDREIISTYEKACKSVDSATKLLHGYTEGKTVVASIDAQIADAKKTLDAVETALKQAGQSADVIAELTGRQRAVVSDLKTAKTNAEKKLKKWSKVKDEFEPKYEAIRQGLDAIEGFLEEAPGSVETPEQAKARHEQERARREAKKQ